MIFLTNFSNKSVAILSAVFIFLIGCSLVDHPVRRMANESSVIDQTHLIAVLPFYNLSATRAPVKDIRESLINSLKNAGANILDDDVLEKFSERHRIRYTGGIGSLNAEALGKETGAETVLITSLDLYSETALPKIALTSRLVSANMTTSILWMKGVGLSGNDSPGIIELGLIEDPRILTKKAVQQLSDSLSGYLANQKSRIDSPRKKFKPKVYYRSPIIDPEIKYRIAVVPFFNLSERKYAGEIVAFHFVRQLLPYKNLDVIEPGIVRQALLGLRVILHDGLSLINAGITFKKLNADLILTGKVLDYQDYRGSTGTPKVDFSVLLIDRKSNEVVWSSKSYNEGDDGVFFFDWGRVNTAHAMASEMAQNVVEMITEETP